ncbi:Gdf5 [Echinococcus multilocularis]|uniref:Gdf5 n=1 Tax=Echinococcus multilocularis TaxID=6211 RepID=A0A0S4MLT6_ECHMU|nr:Gdf5 [Echinococcus multilocularis]
MSPVNAARFLRKQGAVSHESPHSNSDNLITLRLRWRLDVGRPADRQGKGLDRNGRQTNRLSIFKLLFLLLFTLLSTYLLSSPPPPPPPLSSPPIAAFHAYLRAPSLCAFTPEGLRSKC